MKTILAIAALAVMTGCASVATHGMDPSPNAAPAAIGGPGEKSGPTPGTVGPDTGLDGRTVSEDGYVPA